MYAAPPISCTRGQPWLITSALFADTTQSMISAMPSIFLSIWAVILAFDAGCLNQWMCIFRAFVNIEFLFGFIQRKDFVELYNVIVINSFIFGCIFTSRIKRPYHKGNEINGFRDFCLSFWFFVKMSENRIVKNKFYIQCFLCVKRYGI